MQVSAGFHTLSGGANDVTLTSSSAVRLWLDRRLCGRSVDGCSQACGYLLTNGLRLQSRADSELMRETDRR